MRFSEYHAIARQGQNVWKKDIAGRPTTGLIARLGDLELLVRIPLATWPIRCGSQ